MIKLIGSIRAMQRKLYGLGKHDLCFLLLSHSALLTTYNSPSHPAVLMFRLVASAVTRNQHNTLLGAPLCQILVQPKSGEHMPVIFFKLTQIIQ